MAISDQELRAVAANANSRSELWTHFVRSAGVSRMAEIGVFRGDYAAKILQTCTSIDRYYMIDPWRHLQGWNKPANRDDDVFEKYFEDAMAKTSFAAEKRVVLRGTTAEMIDQIPDGFLDFAYIDGDHTLRGITIDLSRVYPKVREGGWIGGDDFTATPWQHSTAYEPTLVFPYAVYYAEAVGDPICGLPYSQFLIQKSPGADFSFSDLSGGRFGDTTLRGKFRPAAVLKKKLAELLPWR